MHTPHYDYQSAVVSAQAEEVDIRLDLARCEDAPPEILYYLTADPSVAVRRAVAGNPATPRKADLILAKDPDVGVRCALARRMVGEGLDPDEREQLRRMAFTILEALARDAYVAVRRVLAEALAGLAAPPKDIVRGLARDTDRSVAEPLLATSPALEDSDLEAIVRGGSPEWARAAVARRPNVAPTVAAAIIDAGGDEAVRVLLENPGAEIAETDLERVIERAPDIEAWHAPLARRPFLPLRLIEAIASFVSAPLVAVLAAREDVPEEARARVAAGASAPRRARSKPADEWHGPDAGRETPEERAMRLYLSGRLTDGQIMGAVASRDRVFLAAALAARAEIEPSAARAMLASRSGAVIAALCWKAGLDCADALTVQIEMGGLAHDECVAPVDGGYPLSAGEMDFKLELYL